MEKIENSSRTFGPTVIFFPSALSRFSQVFLCISRNCAVIVGIGIIAACTLRFMLSSKPPAVAKFVADGTATAVDVPAALAVEELIFFLPFEAITDKYIRGPLDQKLYHKRKLSPQNTTTILQVNLFQPEDTIGMPIGRELL